MTSLLRSWRRFSMKKEPSHSDCKMSPAGTAENRPRRTHRQPSAVPSGLVTIRPRGWSFSGTAVTGKLFGLERRTLQLSRKPRSVGHPGTSAWRDSGSLRGNAAGGTEGKRERTKRAGFVSLRKARRNAASQVSSVFVSQLQLRTFRCWRGRRAAGACWPCGFA
jgi:hypothetical protein